MGARKTKPKSYDYGWDDLKPGESHFKFKRPLSRMRDAWSAYRKSHPELQTVKIVFTETPKGVIYQRVE